MAATEPCRPRGSRTSVALIRVPRPLGPQTCGPLRLDLVVEMLSQTLCQFRLNDEAQLAYDRADAAARVS
ncbi:hypothetical protein GCM10009717_01460 [Agromyces allii]|uniref:Uncharacterized protein n=1 Tax=Agromyces allii TaxID=393607 RepID=A0ABP5BAP6_9MICO